MKNIKFILSILLINIFFLSSIPYKTCAEVYSNNSQTQNTDKDILDNLNKNLRISLLNNNPQGILYMASNEFKKSNYNIKYICSKVSNKKYTAKLKIQKEYDVKPKNPDNYKLTINTSEKDKFNVKKLTAIGEAMHIALLILEDNKSSDMITAVYAKSKGVWQLYSLNIGDYTYHGLDALGYYEKAKKLQKDGWIVPAYLYSDVASSILHPSDFMQYKDQGEVEKVKKNLYDKLIKTYKFPIRIGNKRTSPNIFRVYVAYSVEGITPIIMYKSSIALKNQNEIKKEAYEMVACMENVFPGITKSFKYIIFRAYSQYPNKANKNYEFQSTIIQLDI